MRATYPEKLAFIEIVLQYRMYLKEQYLKESNTPNPIIKATFAVRF
jgi:hypothetical protein